MEENITTVGELLTYLAGSWYYYMAMGVVIYLLSRLLRLKGQRWELGNERKAGHTALLVLAALILLVLQLTGSIQHSGDSTTPVPNYAPVDVLAALSPAFFIMIPMFVALRVRREPLQSVGITREGWSGAIAVGIALSVIITVVDSPIDLRVISWKNFHVWTLLYWAVVGFSEEIVYRGFV